MSTQDAAEEDLLLDRQVCFPLYAAANLVVRLYRPVLAPLGLTYPQYLVMLLLWEESPRSIGALGARLHLDSGTLTPLVKRLAANGFVARDRDAADERRVLVSLTEKGRALRERAAGIPGALAGDLPVSREDLEHLRETVGDLVRVMADRDAQAPGRGGAGEDGGQGGPGGA